MHSIHTTQNKICSQGKPEFPRVSVKPRTGPEHPQNTLQQPGTAPWKKKNDRTAGLMFVSQMTISSYRRKRRTLYLFFEGWRKNSNLCINCGRLRLDVIYQAWDVVFHHQMIHWKESWKYDAHFEVFHLVMKHCVECLILLLKQNDFRGRN